MESVEETVARTLSARTLCEKRGCTLFNYVQGQTAYILLPSSERVIVSFGTITAKVFSKRAIVGWLAPKVLLSVDVHSWDPDWDTLLPSTKWFMGGMIIDSMLTLVTACNSLEEIRQKYASNFGDRLFTEVERQLKEEAQRVSSNISTP